MQQHKLEMGLLSACMPAIDHGDLVCTDLFANHAGCERTHCRLTHLLHLQVVCWSANHAVIESSASLEVVHRSSATHRAEGTVVVQPGEGRDVLGRDGGRILT